MRRARLSLLVAVLAATAAHRALRAEDGDEVRVSTLVRGDTDTTVVVNPSVRARVELFDPDTHIDAEYTADIWTSASIDIRTAATQAVTEQRDELNAGIDRRIEDFTLRGGYRYSSENDYEAHGGLVSGALDLADHNSTLELRLTAENDRVGRSGDEIFSRPLTVFGGRLGYTQVIDPQMVVQVAYELGHAEGFQSSPYRFVGIGGDGRCNGTALLCVPETHPSVRTRHAFVARGRRAFDDHLSAHLDYRFYIDDWGLYANTAAVQLNWMHDEHGLLALRYRLHQQGAAGFYRSTYPDPSGTLRFVTRDRELSPLWTHRLGLSYERGIALGEAGPELRIAAALGGTYLSYADFVGLTEVLALDGTISLGVEL
ncbi:MAG: DUF3570 domain-containing protein [Deltaproteobacteria bacterium]|jgi:hypothetical protein